MKIIYRKFWDGEVIALMLGIPGATDPGTCMSYTHRGQHGVAVKSLADTLEPATTSEAQALRTELVGIYGADYEPNK